MTNYCLDKIIVFYVIIIIFVYIYKNKYYYYPEIDKYIIYLFNK